MALKIGLSRIVGGKTKLPTSPEIGPSAKRTLKKCNRKFIRHYTEVALQQEFLEMQQEAEEQGEREYQDRKGPEELAWLEDWADILDDLAAQEYC
jgi:hypothetical protein